MARITSGKFKGRKLIVPEIKEIRLVKDKVKLAVFSILGEKVIGADCLDLYAGSGSFGLEALSRKAKSCDFVDNSFKSIEAIKQNIFNCGIESDYSEVIKDDVVKFVANTEKTYDLIFVDPFYNVTKHRFLLQNLDEILRPEGVVIFSHGVETDIQDQILNTRFKVFTTRKYGAAVITVLNRG